jgi:hypothetical protein
VWEHGYTAHDGLDWVRVDNALFHARDEEGSLATPEIVIQVDEECEERGLACVRGRRVVLIGISSRMDARRWPGAILQRTLAGTRCTRQKLNCSPM